VSNLIGVPLEIVDVHSFLAMYREIYEQQAYRFQAKTEVPFIIDGGGMDNQLCIYAFRV